jgi:uncharacterized protein
MTRKSKLWWRGAGLLGLLLLAPLSGLAADCRPVPTAEKTAGARNPAFSKGLLWKIESGNAAASHLFGTFHTNDPRITRLPCPVKETFDRSRSYTMEIITNGAGIVAMAEAMFLSDGKTLAEVLGEPLYQQTLRAIGIDNAKQAGGIKHLKPWAVMMTLNGPGEGRGLFLDMALQYEATRQDKPTYALESMAEQIAVFNGMSLEDQVVLLRDALETQGMADDAMEKLTRAYLNRDLAALVALSEAYKPADVRVHQAMMDRLLTQRNRNMAERMGTRLREGNAFIAVGALHLPGEQGLLQLLTDAGYRVTRVY